MTEKERKRSNATSKTYYKKHRQQILEKQRDQYKNSVKHRDVKKVVVDKNERIRLLEEYYKHNKTV